MMELAAKYGEGPTSLKSIAEKNQLSEHYLEQLIAPLRNAGLVKSVRGAYGGYILSKEASEITAGDIIRIRRADFSGGFHRGRRSGQTRFVAAYPRQHR